MPGRGLLHGRRGQVLATALVAVIGLGVLAVAVWPDPPHRATAATVAPTAFHPAPVYVPRLRHHPRVVDPVAGAVTSAPSTPPPDSGAVNVGPPAEGPAPTPPSDADVRKQLAMLQAVSRRYHFSQLDFSSELLPADQLPGSGWHQSIASVFYDYGLGLACGGTLRPDQLGVANKTVPCGTMVTFRYGGRAIRVPVIDRGPYIQGREWDLTGATAAALGFPGLGIIDWNIGR